MSDLQAAYGVLLRAYPRRWRAERGDELLAVLLDGAEARGATRPSMGEVIDLVGHGLAARVGVALDVRTRERTAALALASLTALAMLTFTFGEWWPWSAVDGFAPDSPAFEHPGAVGPFFTLGGPVLLAVLLPAFLVLVGQPQWGRRMLLALLPVLLLLPVAASLLGVNRPALWTLSGLVGFTLLALLAPVRSRRLLTGVMAALVLTLAYAIVSPGIPSFDPRAGFAWGDMLRRWNEGIPLGVLLAIAVSPAARLFTPVALVGAGWLGVVAARLYPQEFSAWLAAGAAVLVTAAVMATRRGRPLPCTCCGKEHAVLSRTAS